MCFVVCLFFACGFMRVGVTRVGFWFVLVCFGLLALYALCGVRVDCVRFALLNLWL